MPGHHRGAVEDNDLIGAQQGPQPGTDEPCRHGVVGLPDADPRVPVDSRGQRGPGLERLTRQRPQQRCLEREVGGDTDRAALQTAVVVGRVGGRDQGVELGDRVHPGHRDQVVAAEPAALDLDPALLVGALLARAAVEGVEPVVGPEGDPLAGLHPSAAEQHPSDRRLEVVVADVDHRHPAQLGERVHMAFQEGLLALRLERPVHRLARERAPQREQEHLGLRPAVDDPQVGEVDLGLRAWLVHLRDVDLLRRPARLGPDLRPAHVHVVPHRRVRDLGQLVLLDQPGMDPPRGMPLLARRRQVLPQHAVDQRLGRVQPRRRTVRRCTPYRSASPRIDSSSRRASRRIASNSSTLDRTLRPSHTHAPTTTPNSADGATPDRHNHPGVSTSGARSNRHTVHLTPTGGARSDRPGGALSG